MEQEVVAIALPLSQQQVTDSPSQRKETTMKTKIFVALTMIVGLALSSTLTTQAADDEAGFKALFDGKTLKGWDGNPDLWSVSDGAITGQTTKKKPTRGNTFLVWRDGKVADFELRLKFRIVGGNSGIQYRSKEVKKWVISGYQADFDGGNGWTGSLYEEKGRGVLAKRGNKIEVTAKGKKKKTGTTTPAKDIVASVKKEGWNDYTIIAKGNHLIQKVNGKISIELVDNQEARRAMEGLLALQLHAGPPMLVQFKDIRIKILK
jgi:hypothetical protein